MQNYPLLSFRQEKEMIERELSIVVKLDAINKKLHNHNWAFLHPYSQGMDIGILERIIETASDPKAEILKFFAHKFLNLRNTVHHLKGFFPYRPFMKDYGGAIKESVILCLQKDFRGAIYILIPVIEGVLRKQLMDRPGSYDNITSIKVLIGSLEVMKENYLVIRSNYFQKHFNTRQIGELMVKHDEYFELWTQQFRGFLQQNLYLDTRRNKVMDSFNRHIILHALDYEVEFSFSNYLRLFNCILYLSWGIGAGTEGCSILSEADEHEVLRETANYLNILIVSEAIAEMKGAILENQLESFKQYLHPKYLALISTSEAEIRRAFRHMDVLKRTY